MLAESGDKLLLPVDHVVTAELAAGAPIGSSRHDPRRQNGRRHRAEDNAELFEAVIRAAKTIIWNGPMGVFEKPPFDKGTVAVAKAVAGSGAISVVGGGDSEKAVKSAGVADKVSHVSTGGGASLEFLSGIELPGVAALNDKK